VLGHSRLLLRLTWISCISFLVGPSLGAVVAAGQQPAASADPLASLRTGGLVVWASGLPERLPEHLHWAAIQAALTKDFPELQVTFRVVAPQSLLAELAYARAQGTLPDVVFVDNWQQGGPLVAQQLVVQLAGFPRFTPSSGWWFLMQEGKRLDAATAFFGWLEDDPHGRLPTSTTRGLTQRDRAEISNVEVKAVLAMASGSDHNIPLDPEASVHFNPPLGGSCGTDYLVTSPSIEFIFGNGRIAYGALWSTAISRQGGEDARACEGAMRSFVVLRKREDGWKVLLLEPMIADALTVRQANGFSSLHLSNELGIPPSSPLLIAPYNGQPQTRFPKQEISWRQSQSRPAAYLVESQVGQPRHWKPEDFGSSMITFVNPAQYGDVVRMPMPFGVGMQPHRWRVWAIAQDGEVALSEWRTVDFTN
jgi:hypothetical protein